MANLYFSRDTKLYGVMKNTTGGVKSTVPAAAFEIPILEGYSFSQANNTSEITLSEMENSSGVSRRGRRLFNDSLAPAEWSFSTYVRPFKSDGSDYVNGDTHAVEEFLWANMAGADKYDETGDEFQSDKFSDALVTTSDATDLNVSFAQSNRAVLHSMDLYFVIETSTSNPLVYKLQDAAVNEANITFEVDGIATIEWSGFAKNILDISADTTVGGTVPTDLGRDLVYLKDDADLQFNIGTALGATILNQTEADFVTFNGGDGVGSTAYVINDVITMSDGSTVRVDNIDGNGDVTEFTITGESTSEVTAGQILTQSSLSGTGDDTTFTLTLASGNIATNPSTAVTAKDEGVTRTSNFIRNRLTQLTLGPVVGTPTANSAAFDTAGYDLTLTGGSVTISNNIEYLIPEEIGKVNIPLENVTGSRTITGSFTCYAALETSDNSGTSTDLYNDFKKDAALDLVVNEFDLAFDVGGSTATTRLQINMDRAHLEIPVTNIEDVLSFEVNFHGLGTDISATDEVNLIYFGATE